MQIYTENRFGLPLFYLIVLGVALSIWICPDKAFATGASSGVHDDQPRQAPEGLPPSRMPEAFPGFSPDTPSIIRSPRITVSSISFSLVSASTISGCQAPSR